MTVGSLGEAALGEAAFLMFNAFKCVRILGSIKGGVFPQFELMTKRKSYPDDELEQAMLSTYPEVFKKQRFTARDKRKIDELDEVFTANAFTTKRQKKNPKKEFASTQTDAIQRDPFVVLKSKFLKERGIKNVTIYFS